MDRVDIQAAQMLKSRPLIKSSSPQNTKQIPKASKFDRSDARVKCQVTFKTGFNFNRGCY